MSGRPLALCALSLMGMLLVGGCGGNGDGGGPRFRDHDVSVDYPSGWKHDDLVARDGMVLNVHGTPDRDDLYPRVTLFSQRAETDSLDALARSTADSRLLLLTGTRRGKTTDIRLPSGLPGRRVVTDATIKLHKGGTAPGRLVDLLAIKGERQYNLRVFGPVTAFDGSSLEHVERSFDVER